MKEQTIHVKGPDGLEAYVHLSETGVVIEWGVASQDGDPDGSVCELPTWLFTGLLGSLALTLERRGVCDPERGKHHPDCPRFCYDPENDGEPVCDRDEDPTTEELQRQWASDCFYKTGFASPPETMPQFEDWLELRRLALQKEGGSAVATVGAWVALGDGLKMAAHGPSKRVARERAIAAGCSAPTLVPREHVDLRDSNDRDVKPENK